MRNLPPSAPGGRKHDVFGGLAALRPPIGGISPGQGETPLAAANMTYMAWIAALNPSIGGIPPAREEIFFGAANPTFCAKLAALSPSRTPT